MTKQGPASVDEYIRTFPEPARSKLSQLRGLIREVAPEAQERISYRMPAYYLNGMLVYFAGYARHIGFYPGANGISRFSADLSRYKSGKGSVQFALDQDLPDEIIKRIVKHRVEENSRKKK